MSDYHPFNPDTKSPAEAPPPLSCDCQFHVFGEPSRYPVAPNAGYTMPTATFGALRAMHRKLGIERGVIVQATSYGTDHSALLDALEEGGEAYRGCAVSSVLESGTDAYVEKLHAAGVRGARFNFLKKLNMVPTGKTLDLALSRVRELGWYIKIQPDNEGVLETLQLFEGIRDIPVVIDHLARAPSAGSPVAQKVAGLLRGTDNFWVMLSNGFKLAKTGYPWDEAVPVAQAYIDAAPDRVLWASDWPHPLMTSPAPNDGDLFELFCRYAPDEQTRKRILVDNPARLFGFGA